MKHKKLLIVFGVVIFCLLVFVLTFIISSRKNMIIGTSYSPDYARYLNLDPRESFKIILNTWDFKHVRLSAAWDELEAEQGKFNFDELDWYMAEAEKSNAKVVLVVGQKTPRWPECHLPAWAEKIDNKTEYRKLLFNYITQVVNRYKNSPALEMWQVENEPFLAFGKCGVITSQQYQEEVAMVKKIDNIHPTIATDSGELSTWRKSARAADFFGTTMYRVVWNKYTGYWKYDWVISPLYYKVKLWLNGRDISTAMVSELQGEPWIPDMHITSTPLEEQYKSMDLSRLKKNILFAQKTGMPRAYLWGAEWWLWVEKQGVSEFVDFIKTLKKQ